MIIIKEKYKIPHFHKLINSCDGCHYKMTSYSKDFYKYFKDNFDEGKIIEIPYLDVGEPYFYEKYILKLLKEFKKRYLLDNNLELFTHNYNILKKYYNVYLRWDFYYYFVDFLVSIKEYQLAWEEWNILRMEEWKGMNYKNIYGTYRNHEIKTIMKFEKHLNTNLVDSSQIFRMAYKGNQLTSFGKKNINEVFEVLDTILKTYSEQSFFENFYKNYNRQNPKNKSYSLEDYKKYFKQTNEDSKSYDRIINDSFYNAKLKNGKASSDFVILSIQYEAGRLLREAENEYRLIIGAKKIGEGWISETELYYKIKTHFKELDVIHHGRPDWLGRQHFDIWIPELNIAIEYQGQQHDSPVEFFGGEKAYKQNVKRDRLKKRKCEENNCLLLEVRPNYDLRNIINQIEKFEN